MSLLSQGRRPFMASTFSSPYWQLNILYSPAIVDGGYQNEKQEKKTYSYIAVASLQSFGADHNLLIKSYTPIITPLSP